jgi:hypothetical protein
VHAEGRGGVEVAEVVAIEVDLEPALHVRFVVRCVIERSTVDLHRAVVAGSRSRRSDSRDARVMVATPAVTAVRKAYLDGIRMDELSLEARRAGFALAPLERSDQIRPSISASRNQN